MSRAATDQDVRRAGEWTERLLSDELYWLPVRHHSPLVARHVRSAIRERRPKVVFIEGPSEAADLIRHVVDARTRPPVALYSAFCETAGARNEPSADGTTEEIAPPARLAENGEKRTALTRMPRSRPSSNASSRVIRSSAAFATPMLR